MVLPVRNQHRAKYYGARSAFIVCNAGSNIQVLIQLLQNLGVTVLNLEDTSVGGPIVSRTRDLVDQADFICVAMDAGDASPHVYFEFGYAVGIGCPVILITKDSRLLADAEGAFLVSAGLDDEPALRLQLQAFIENVRPRRRTGLKAASLGHRPAKSQIAKMPEAPLITNWGNALERKVGEAFQRSDEIESLAAQPRLSSQPSYIPDFAVWFRNPPESVSGPAIVEVRGSHGVHWGEKAEHILAYAHAHDVRTALIILDDGAELAEGLLVINLLPLVVILSVERVCDLLETGQLLDSIRRERNRFAHSAS